MNFEGISITKELVGLLNSAVAAERLPHAIVLEGSSEGDRLALARLIARAHICSGEGEKPCGKCPDCVKALSGFHADIFESLAEQGDKDPLKVDAVRAIRAEAYVYPNEAQRKVFILHNVQFCNEQAQNALLKVLEEPPEYVRFVLTCPVSTVLLRTILSRSSVYSMGQQVADVSAKKQEKACEAAKAIAAAVVSPNEFDLMRETGCFEKNNALLALALEQLRLIFRDAVAFKQSSGAVALSESAEEARLLARSLTLPRLFSLLKTVDVLEGSINANGNNNLLVTRLCSLLREAAGK